MEGTRITSEEKASLSTYIGVGIAVVLVLGAVYLFFVSQRETNQMKGFDPNRPVPSDVVLRHHLTPTEYFVTREGGTETAFQNAYYDKWDTGIYVDVITGEPLFTSLDKYHSGLGIPSFTKPISKDLLVEKLDTSHDMQRTEVRAKRSDAHLGHVFPEPASPTGQRYSINSAALHFIPMEEMQKDGYGAFLPLLGKK